MRRLLPAVALLALLALPPASVSAAPHTTADATYRDTDGDNLLEPAPGERHNVRLPNPKSLVHVLQLSDFQMVDEESPGRVEFVDGTQRAPFLAPFSAAYRPQEALTTQVTEAMVRQARNTTSPVTGEQIDLAVLTGDNADSQQYNETRWFIDILDGTVGTPREIDPNSGVPVPGCEATPNSIYDGVRDSGTVGAPDDGYYEPDGDVDGDGYSPDRARNAAETPGRDVTVRDFPGLFEAANKPFEAVGLGVPWYSAFGNHDALVQGNEPDAYAGPGPLTPATEAFNPAFNAIATGCAKVKQPSAATRAAIEAASELGDVDALAEAARTALGEDEDDGATVATVPPDNRRCYLAKDEPLVGPPGTPCQQSSWIGEHFNTTGAPVGHGYAQRPPQAVANHDGYYAFVPKPGFRFIVLDTVSDECGAPVCAEGSVDDPQFEWLRGQLALAEQNQEYVLAFSHHTLRTTRQPVVGDAAEQPIHHGQRVDRENPANPQATSPAETLEELFCSSRQFLAHVTGHEHQNYVRRHRCAQEDSAPTPGAGDFHEISTAAHIDWPQQSRLVELVDLGGEVALVLTMLDHAGPPNPGAGSAEPANVLRLASIARELAYNDYQGQRGAEGDPADRNVVLPTGRPAP